MPGLVVCDGSCSKASGARRTYGRGGEQRTVIPTPRLHAEHYLRLARRLERVNAREDWEMIDIERPNMLAATTWACANRQTRLAADLALAVCPLLARRGDWAARYWNWRAAHEITERGVRPRGPLTVELMHQIGIAFRPVGARFSGDVAPQVLGTSPAVARPARVGPNVQSVGVVEEARGRFSDAESLGTTALELMTELRDLRGMAEVLNNLGNIAQSRASKESSGALAPCSDNLPPSD